MKIINDFINKVGADKVLHFTIAALITAWGGLFGGATLLLSAIGIIALSLVKEHLDSEFSAKDIYYSIGGSMTSIIMYTLVNLF